MRTYATAMLGIAAAAFGLSVAFAQQGGSAQPTFAKPPQKNLKIYPADMPRAQLLGTMRLFSQSLGVRCTYCHVGEERKPLSTFDFASDAKPTKAIARRMILMAQRINREDFGVTSFANVKVTCFTCHRGSTKPVAMPPATPERTPAATPPKSERG